jgi:hypothetical protein
MKAVKVLLPFLCILAVACGAPETEEIVERDIERAQQPIGYSGSGMLRVVFHNIKQGSWGENLSSDGRNILWYLADPARTYLPDVLMLQEMKFTGSSNYHYCSQFASQLSSYVSQRAGLSPNYTTWRNDAIGGACVLLRNRLQAEQVYYNLGKVTGTNCDSAGGNGSISVRAYDTLKGYYVNIASVHLPNGGGNCTIRNLNEIMSYQGSAGMHIIGGDFNVTTSQGGSWGGSWVSNMNNNGYGRVTLTAPDGSQWTSGGALIDYLFVKSSSNVTGASLVGFDSARGISAYNYSDHRGGGANVYY